MSLEHVVGTATVISSLAGRFIGYPAQIRLILKTRMVGNLSVALHSIGFVSCLLWTWHGWLSGDWVILLTQGLAGIAATGSMLFLIWRYRPRRVAGKSVIDLLVHFAALDGTLHPKARLAIEQFAGMWKLELDWSIAGKDLTATQRRDASMDLLRSYLACTPPVVQMRELRDLIWILAEADGKLTADERELGYLIDQQLAFALRPFGLPEHPAYRVLVIPEGAALQTRMPGFTAHLHTERQVLISDIPLTAPIARQFASDLRNSRFAALAVEESEVSGFFKSIDDLTLLSASNELPVQRLR